LVKLLNADNVVMPTAPFIIDCIKCFLSMLTLFEIRSIMQNLKAGLPVVIVLQG
jgi:hypothetical protein